MIILIDLQGIDMADEVVRFRYDRSWFFRGGFEWGTFAMCE